MSKEGRRLLNLGRVATLATINSDGTPHVVPVVYAVVGDRLVTAIDSKPKRSSALTRLDNIERDPRVSVLAHHYAEDWHRLWWVRIDGMATVAPEDTEAVAALKGRYSQYDQYQVIGPIISVAMEKVRVWTAAED